MLAKHEEDLYQTVSDMNAAQDKRHACDLWLHFWGWETHPEEVRIQTDLHYLYHIQECIKLGSSCSQAILTSLNRTA